MKKLILSILVVVAYAQNIHATTYLSDAFPYPTGSLSAQGGWNSGSACQVTAGSLSVAGLESPTITSNKVSLNSSAGSALKSFTASPISSGNVYLSFILRQTTLAASTTGGTIAGLDDDGTVSASNGRVASALGIHLKQTNSTTYLVGIRKGQGASGAGGGTDLFYTGDSFVTGETVFIVARYSFDVGAGDDTVTLWVNPATNSFGGIEPTASLVATNSGNTTDATQLQHVFLRANSSSTSGINEIDDVRVGSTWADVTPSGGVVEPPITNTQPRITQSFFTTSGLVLRGTNGVSNGVYQVLSSPSIALPMVNWPAIATNLFDASGNFDSTNPVSPSDAQRFYRILVGGQLVLPTNTAPYITTQPQSQTVIVSNNATFTVVAAGDAPLRYQWYFNTNTALAGATNASLLISNVTASNTGVYQVTVTNAFGSVTSSQAQLQIASIPPTGSPDGYATRNGGTTGGAGGATVTVSDLASFEHYVGTNQPCIIQVSGTINLGGSNVRVRDNKTIVGLGTNAALIGDLKVFANNNVIIRNLTLSNPGVGDNDGLTLQECLNVWVDHCTFVDCDDGSLDISHGADWITVSWCHFYYTNPGNTHRFANLVGHSDSSTAEAEDTGKLHITYHHNWWGQLVHERMPRVRFGRVHLYNNFYNSPGNNNCIRAARDCEILVENNYFDSVKNVWELYRTVGLDGKVFATNNIEVNTTWSAGSDSSSIQIPGTDVLTSDANGLNPVPYAYTLQTTSIIPGVVTNGAGAGKGPFAP